MELFSTNVLAGIGVVALVLAGLLLLLLIIGLIASYIIFKNHGIAGRLYSGFSSILLKILLFIVDSLHIPSKKIVSWLGGDDRMIDQAAIEMRNIILRKSFSRVPCRERIVLLPQCLRDLDCKTRFSSIEGAQCLSCGKCKIFEITKRAKELGYKGSYIAPGGGFVKRIIKRFRPQGVLGIGCPFEVNMGLLEVSNKGIPCQGVILLRNGCVETDVDLEKVFKAMEFVEDGS